MIVILGESSSGKTTLENWLTNNDDRFHKIITFTTRPMREGEEDGVDYHFVTEAAFDQFEKRDFFIDISVYNGWKYGVAEVDCKIPNGVIVLTPCGLRRLKRKGINLMAVYLYVDRPSRLIQSICRGDDIDEAYRRNLSDVGMYDGVMEEIDYIIDNTKFHMNEEQVLQCMEKIIEEHYNLEDGTCD